MLNSHSQSLTQVVFKLFLLSIYPFGPILFQFCLWNILPILLLFLCLLPVFEFKFLCLLPVFEFKSSLEFLLGLLYLVYYPSNSFYVYWNLIVFAKPNILNWLDACKLNPKEDYFKHFEKLPNNHSNKHHLELMKSLRLSRSNCF